MKRALSALLVSLMLISAPLFANGNKEESKAVDAFSAKVESDVEITFWNGFTGSDGITLDKIIEGFTTENPNITVKTEKIAWGTYFDKLLTSLISGTPPDMFVLHENEIPQYASQGVLMDTSDFYMPVGPLDKNDFEPEYISALEYEGGMYGVPLDRHGWGIIANNAAFAKAGIDPSIVPNNEAEFIALAQKLTLDANGNNAASANFDVENVVQWGTHTSWLKPQFLTILWQNGGDWTDGNGNATLDSDASKKTLQFFYDLIYKYNVAPVPSGYDGWQSFANDELAILPEGCWMYNFLEDNNVDYSVWEYPQIGNVEASVWTSGHVLYMPAGLDGEKLAATKQLIAYIFNNTATWATAGMSPASMSVRASLDPEEVPVAAVYGKSYARQGRFSQAHIAIGEIIDGGFMPELDACLNGLKTVDEALTDANKTVQAILDRN